MTKEYKLVLQDRETKKLITFERVRLTDKNALAIEKRRDYLGLEVIEIERGQA